ncbi:Flagellar associated protein [Phytophthora cinnamomi]|uniref:Flagellar associated protein n=1 Tax=Phytophthora cinnamomi TaxID=4785 RepID=UPI00355A1202|nr:Flagellar associated protein [Phytophthora cinnamomi]
MAARDDVDAVAAASSGQNGVVENPRAPVQQRLHDGFRTDRRYLAQMVLEAQNERGARVEAVLELKQDLDASSAKIAAQSSIIQAQQQAERAHQARTHQSLLDQGKNPYEVARRKVVQREARKERSKIERNIQDREAKLLGRLEAEKVLQRRREKLEAENRAYERKYQREMGRAAQEERTNAYLLSRTGKEALDPTGKMVRVYPSQETTIIDYSFGLGRSAVLSPEHRRRVVAKVLAKPSHAGTEPTSLLLPRRRGHHSQQDSDDRGALTPRSGRSEREEKEDAELTVSERLVMPALPGVKPGQDLRKVNHVLLSNSDVKLPPIAAKGSRRSQDPRHEDDDNPAAEDSAQPTKLKKARGRSVLEERQLAKVRRRQKDSRFAQSQVVWGKTFSGNAFLANPQMLCFKDFDVGRPLTLSFTLTNVSNTFNQFRLLAMDDEVIELFDIVYEKPGHELELTALGVHIRVRLRGEGINPSLTLTPPNGNLDFLDVLARTRSVRELVLANGSAFPLAFSIVALDESYSAKQEEASGVKAEKSMTTSTGLPVFTFSPTSAVIPENGSITVQVVFQPDHQRPGHYARRYRIKVPNESEQHVISVAGRCWENQLYVFAPTADISPVPSDHVDTEVGLLPKRSPLLTPRPVEDLFDLPPSVPLSQLPPSIGVGELPAAGLRKPPSSVILTFAGDEVLCSSRGSLAGETDTGGSGRITKTLFIGSTTPSSGIYGGLDEVPAGAVANAGGSAGSFELVVDAASPHAKMFTLEPARGAIAAGQQLAIQVTYHPPVPAAASALGSDTPTPSSSARSTGAVSVPASSARAKSAQRRLELEVVQWVQVRVQCTLKGGALWRTLPVTGAAPVPSAATATSGHQQKGATNAGASTVPDGADTRIVTVILRARLEN